MAYDLSFSSNSTDGADGTCDDAIRWYENDGSQQFTSRDIFTSACEAQSVYAIDVDGDGDIDVLSASNSYETVRWYENHQENLTNK